MSGEGVAEEEKDHLQSTWQEESFSQGHFPPWGEIRLSESHKLCENEENGSKSQEIEFYVIKYLKNFSLQFCNIARDDFSGKCTYSTSCHKLSCIY